jgi:hypothetical protein
LERSDVVAAVSVEKAIRERPGAKQKERETPEQPAVGIEKSTDAAFQKLPCRSWLAVRRVLSAHAAEAVAHSREAGRAPHPRWGEASGRGQRLANDGGCIGPFREGQVKE